MSYRLIHLKYVVIKCIEHLKSRNTMGSALIKNAVTVMTGFKKWKPFKNVEILTFLKTVYF